MATTVTGAFDLGNDVLLVQGTVDGVTGPDGKLATVNALGWVSAMTHHYPPGSYDATGSLVAGAAARAMTAAEKLAYCKRLLAAAAPAGPGVSGKNLGISG